MLPRRDLHLLIALLLPLMVMRGLLPAGYLPVAEGGVITMALCSDGLRLPGNDPWARAARPCSPELVRT